MLLGTVCKQECIMPSLYLPVAAAIISLIILLVYCTKKRVHINENTLYLIMLIAILGDSLSVTFIFLNFYVMELNETLIRLLNRIDYTFLIMWATCLFLYTFIVIHKEDEGFEKRYNIVSHYIVIPVSAILVGCAWSLDINIVVASKEYATAQGPAVNFSIIACVIYFLISGGEIVFNHKKATKRVIPVLVCILITISIAALFTLNPYLICISMGLTVVNLTMFFTIENPDVQMLEIVSAAREQAQKANQAKTDFLSSMSHEIRTPLNAVVGLAECIMNDETLEQAKTDARDIVNASNNLLELVNGILDISKIEAGKMEVVNKEYDLTEEAVNLAKLIKTRIGEKPVTLNTDIASNIPGVLYGDEAKVRQIMTNLLTNAVKYTDKGYVNFSISCLNEGNIAWLTIKVSDTGRGIKPEQMEGLFEKFKRLDEDKNSTIEGTGLGLSITEKLIDMLNGKIDVESRYGEGSTFTVRIPQTIRSLEKKAAPKVTTATETYTGKKVLVVDDNILNIKVESRMLEFYDLHPDSADSGEDCIKKCEENTYDLILMDDMMPGMNGTETMNKLRENPRFRTPVVILTANALEGMRESYMDAGFDDYLAKPMEKAELRRVLAIFLG